MNIAQHLVLPLLMVLGFSVQAQEVGTSTSSENNSQAAQENEEVPAAQRSLLKTAATKDFNKALYFDQIDNGLILPPLELDYELSANGKQLRMGNIFLNEKNFFFGLLPLEKTHPQLNQAVASADAKKLALVMAWPDKLLNSGTFEVISRTGAVLFRKRIFPNDITAWNQKVEGWRKTLMSAGVPGNSLHGGIFSAQYAILNVEGEGVFAKAKESFRFCLSQEEGRTQSKLCSQRYAVKETAQGLVMGKVSSEKSTMRVLVNNEDAPFKQSKSVTTENPVGFYAEFSTGESYEFVSVPNKLQLMDIADTSNPKTLRIVGYDTRPIGRSIILNPTQYTSLTKMIGFEATIGDPRKFWAAAVPINDPKIYLPGQGGGIFKQRFELSEIPRRQSRVYLNKRTPTGTYIDGIELEGRKQPSSEVTSTQNSVELDEKDPGHFFWKFQAKERGQINRAYLNVNFEGKTYKSYYEIYKGFPREISARLSAVGAASTLVFLGEVAYNQWFEDLLGWTNYYASRQRWGIAAKYFKSFNELKVDAVTGQTAQLSVLTVDLKYRFTPGLWNRDETVGLLGSYQNVTFDQLKAPMLGAGIFWARSMPKVIDDVFNVVELMRYPKWVDMEFIYYVKSMDSNVTLNSSMSLNFHGKVLWSDTLFGEAGFGIKRYAFTDTSLNQKAALNTVYGTVGIGLNF